MPTDDSPTIELGYADASVHRASRLAEWMGRLPHWVIALALVLSLFASFFLLPTAWLSDRGRELILGYSPLLLLITLAIPGALRRLNWRHALVMIALAGAAYALLRALARWGPELPHPYSWLLTPLLALFLIGAGEWLLSHPRSRLGIAWAAGFSLACACAVMLVIYTLNYATEPLRPSRPVWMQPAIGLAALKWSLIAILSWTVVQPGVTVTRRPLRARRKMILVAAAATIVAYPLYFHVLIYPIARYSLVEGTPFDPSHAAFILGNRGSAADRQALVRALEDADWSKPLHAWDYRQASVAVLQALDRAEAAGRLSELLRNKPSKLLAGLCAPVLEKERRYDAAPLLLRYAMLGQSDCIAALETMKVPEAALPVLMEELDWLHPAPGEDLSISTNGRQRLAGIIGSDAGPKWSDWEALFEQIKQKPTPLDPTQAWEVKRVAQCMRSHALSARLLYDMRRAMLFQNLRTEGRSQIPDSLDSDLRRVSSPVDNENRLLYVRYDVQEAVNAISVQDPDWNVRTTEALEEQIRLHARRIESLLAERGHVPEPPPADLPH